MSRNTVTITDTALSIEPHGLDKLWSYTSHLEFPLAHVRGATHDPGLRNEPKGWRGPGLQAGSKLSGTFHAEGTAQFWNISGYENTLVITLEEEVSRSSTSRSMIPPAWQRRSTPPSVSPRRDPAASSSQALGALRHETHRPPACS